MRRTTRIRAATIEDLKAVNLQPMQLRMGDAERLQDERLQRLLEMEGEAWAMELEHAGSWLLLGCAGYVRVGPGRARGWALVDKAMVGDRRLWAIAAKAIGARLTILQEYEGWARIEAETPLRFEPGHRLLHHLGFRFEAPLPFAGAGGETYALYGRYGKRMPETLKATRYASVAGLARSLLWEDVIGRAA